jgi:putative redox protein
MVKSTTVYMGHLHCDLVHEPSGSKIETDAPKDNQGKGERFSPTDLVGAALGSCMLTTMAMVATRDGIELKGSRATIEKTMTNDPRRIEQLKVHIELPHSLTPDQLRKLEQVAKHCPVHRSLHPDIKVPVTFGILEQS